MLTFRWCFTSFNIFRRYDLQLSYTAITMVSKYMVCKLFHDMVYSYHWNWCLRQRQPVFAKTKISTPSPKCKSQINIFIYSFKLITYLFTVIYIGI